MYCRENKRRHIAIGFVALNLGLALWGMVVSGAAAFWVGWSIAALFVGYMLAFRMDALSKITDWLKKSPGLSPSLYWVSLTLFVDVYLLATHHISLWGLPNQWLLEHATFSGLAPFLVTFSLFHLIILPDAKVVIVPLKAFLSRVSQPVVKESVDLKTLGYYALKTGDAWAGKIHADAIAMKEDAKQIESSCVSILLLGVADFLLGQFGSVPGMCHALYAWLIELPIVVMAVVGFASLEAWLFVCYMALWRDGQIDGQVDKERFGKDWLKQHGAAFWNDDATKK